MKSSAAGERAEPGPARARADAAPGDRGAGVQRQRTSRRLPRSNTVGSPPVDADGVARAAQIAALGHDGPLVAAEPRRRPGPPPPTPNPPCGLRPSAALVRAAPVRTPHRPGPARPRDADAVVRRRAADLAPELAGRPPGPDPALTDALVAPARRCRRHRGGGRRVGPGRDGHAARVRTVVGRARRRRHRPRRCARPRGGGRRARRDRRSRDGLAAVLAACRDKPAVRRRAVLALAPFTGPDVDAALAAALDDRDWQVRQAAEDLRQLEGPTRRKRVSATCGP